ncbi:HEPN domain-containing protein [Vibrio campbellii]|uniref:HEPN domain-containing protein n=1 Tax=Vibrio campbellii TaxID=680 RepID=UPI00068322A0|nr:HEPN domain-containing protein [Vibrio campbellii]
MYQILKERHRKERDSYPQALSLRVHRALSWLKKAEMCNDDHDSKYIFLWIAFNAAYAQDFEYKADFGERGLYQEFLSKIVSLDGGNKLSELVWSQYSSSIRLILDNEFILQSFWKFHSGLITEEQWKKERSQAKSLANKALSGGDTATVLSVVFSRLYTLRNQLMHGGATYNSSANRDQIRDCTALLESVVPTIIEIMMDGADELWGDAVYPLVSP